MEDFASRRWFRFCEVSCGTEWFVCIRNVIFICCAIVPYGPFTLLAMNILLALSSLALVCADELIEQNASRSENSLLLATFGYRCTISPLVYTTLSSGGFSSTHHIHIYTWMFVHYRCNPTGRSFPFKPHLPNHLWFIRSLARSLPNARFNI